MKLIIRLVTNKIMNHKKLTVYLTYFKPSGKYYGDGKFEVEDKPLYQIWEEIVLMFSTGHRPGLTPSMDNQFNVLVEVPNHEHEHPHLIMAKTNESQLIPLMLKAASGKKLSDFERKLFLKNERLKG